MQTTVLADDFAVRIDGVDLSAPMDEAAFDALRDLWLQYKVAVFPGQDLEDGDLLSFTRRLGEPFVHVQSQLVSPDHEQVMYMSNQGASRTVHGELGWHTDQCYTPEPVFGTILYGVAVTETGGETQFADLSAAYDNLPDELRHRLERLTAVFAVEKPTYERQVPLTDEQRKAIPPVRHPIIRTHPYLDRKSLYISQNHINCIGDLSYDESEVLLAELVAIATRDGHVYTHRWTPRDVIMWDNTSVMHRRNDFPAEQRRFMKRTGFHFPKELRAPY
ncbi:MAG: TauD/TfdA family dioxygenase [Alphaproteobacteria bacterium]|nr:TauD/TfdA family dioxygenase [Alphaproteobacteria bacterium]